MVLAAAPVIVSVRDTAADTDALSGTDLERAPGRGLLQIWANSSVGTATMSLSVGQQQVMRAQVVPTNAGAERSPDVSRDPPLATVRVNGAEQIVVNLGGTTGTVITVAIWTPL